MVWIETPSGAIRGGNRKSSYALALSNQVELLSKFQLRHDAVGRHNGLDWAVVTGIMPAGTATSAWTTTIQGLGLWEIVIDAEDDSGVHFHFSCLVSYASLSNVATYISQPSPGASTRGHWSMALITTSPPSGGTISYAFVGSMLGYTDRLNVAFSARNFDLRYRMIFRQLTDFAV